MITPIEYVDLQRSPCGLMSYILLLRYSLDHDETILKSIDRPQVLTNENHLILENNCIYQLNVIPDKNSRKSKVDSLASVIDGTSSSLGKRLLFHRILNPVTNINELNSRYNIVEEFVQDDLWKEFEPYLKIIFDIERLQRKISLGRIHPSEFYNLNASYEAILKIFEILHKFSDRTKRALIPHDGLYDNFVKFIEYYHSIYEIDEMMRWNTTLIGSNIFKSGIYSEIDEIWNEICDINRFFDSKKLFRYPYQDILIKEELLLLNTNIMIDMDIIFV